MTKDIDLERLTKSISVIEESYYHGYFTFLLVHASHYAFLISINKEQVINLNYNQLTKRLFIIQTDLMNIATIIHRLDNEFSLMNTQNISFDLWRYYASLDIESLFRKYRSLLDNIAQLIKSFIGSESLPPSFHTLYNKIDKYKEVSLPFKAIIKKIDWFNNIKEIRDKIDHYAAEVNVKKSKNNELMFICSELGPSLTNLPEKNLLYNLNLDVEEGFVNFTKFTGVYVGYLIWSLEEICKLIYTQLKTSELDKQSKLCHPGFVIIRNNIKQLLHI